MRRLSTTVLAVVGPDAEACVRSFADAANVAAITQPSQTSSPTQSGSGEVTDDGPVPSLDRAQAIWRRTERSTTRFTMHAADPLQAVGDAWVSEFDGGARGTLDAIVAETIARWRADRIGLPDYYLVLDPDALQPARKHWYLGVLHRAAAHRIVPVDAEAARVAQAIARLPAGRWWPDLPDLLADLGQELPDQAMLAGPTET